VKLNMLGDMLNAAASVTGHFARAQ